MNQPSPEAIAAFEQGGAGHDAKPVASVSVARRPAATPVRTEKPESAPEEPTRRLSLDLPASVHKRFKTACSAMDLKMTSEVQKYIERRTAELEKRAGVFNN